MSDSKAVWSDDGKTDAAEGTIALDATTIGVPREHRKRQLAERLVAGPAWEDRDLVFC
ncbi:MAG: hypothetical protein M3O70_10675 [Actinomycetota bacterium]|nr:hypothetical protein [Actinomycetota bacterium]